MASYTVTRKESKLPEHRISHDYDYLKNAILIEHNRLREDPVSYIPILEKHRSYLKGNVLYRPKQTPVKTHEGEAAFNSAIEFLRYQKPVPSLALDERLCL